jgi:hypothetical protein
MLLIVFSLLFWQVDFTSHFYALALLDFSALDAVGMFQEVAQKNEKFEQQLPCFTAPKLSSPRRKQANPKTRSRPCC